MHQEAHEHLLEIVCSHYIVVSWPERFSRAQALQGREDKPEVISATPCFATQHQFMKSCLK
jgi:hypothetical protein